MDEWKYNISRVFGGRIAPIFRFNICNLRPIHPARFRGIKVPVMGIRHYRRKAVSEQKVYHPQGCYPPKENESDTALMQLQCICITKLLQKLCKPHSLHQKHRNHTTLSTQKNTFEVCKMDEISKNALFEIIDYQHICASVMQMQCKKNTFAMLLNKIK